MPSHRPESRKCGAVVPLQHGSQKEAMRHGRERHYAANGQCHEENIHGSNGQGSEQEVRLLSES